MSDKEETLMVAGDTNKVAMAAFAGLWLASIGGLAALTHPGSGQSNAAAHPTMLPATDVTHERSPVPTSEEGHVDFIVRFGDIPEVEHCLNTFRQDPEEARSVFENWASQHPILSNFRLKKTNYSGELVLTWQGDGTPPSRQDIMDIREHLQAMPDVKYADPDFGAMTQGAAE